MVQTLQNEIINNWQNAADLLAELINAQSALITTLNKNHLKVVVSNKSKKNPFKAGDHINLQDFYCKTVINTNHKLKVTNALKSDCANIPAAKKGYISYLGFPIVNPDSTPFGTVCILDSKHNEFTETQEKLLYQFARLIERDLALHEANKQDLKTRAILDHHYQLTGLLDTEGKLIEANKKALEFIETDLDDVLNKYFWECPWWDSKQEQEVKDAFYRAVKGEFIRLISLLSEIT